jgi:hypothetical protein
MNTSKQKLTSVRQPGMVVATDVKAGVDSCQFRSVKRMPIFGSPDFLAMKNAKMLRKADFMKSLDPETPTETVTETPIV